MPGPFQRVLGRREQAAVPAEDGASAAHSEPPTAVEQPPPLETAEQPTTDLIPAARPGDDPVAREESWRRRTAMRRRLRYLRRARELALRDLGGLVFDLDRFSRERPDLVRVKLDGLASIDRERRTLEAALDDRREVDVLREPGIASCPRCGALHASDARFCSSCGLPVGPGEALPPGPVATPGDAAPAVPEPVPGAAAATSDGAAT